jgi:hypothetical protein
VCDRGTCPGANSQGKGKLIAFLFEKPRHFIRRKAGFGSFIKAADVSKRDQSFAS